MRIFNEIKGLFLLQLTLLLSAAFSLFKNGKGKYLFPDDNPDTYPYFCNDGIGFLCMSNVELYPDTYWYFLFEHLILVLVAYYIWSEFEKTQTALFIFLIIHVIDTGDYLLAYGQTWFMVGVYPIDWNVLKAIIFTIAIINEVFLIKERELLLR